MFLTLVVTCQETILNHIKIHFSVLLGGNNARNPLRKVKAFCFANSQGWKGPVSSLLRDVANLRFPMEGPGTSLYGPGRYPIRPVETDTVGTNSPEVHSRFGQVQIAIGPKRISFFLRPRKSSAVLPHSAKDSKDGQDLCWQGIYMIEFVGGKWSSSGLRSNSMNV